MLFSGHHSELIIWWSRGWFCHYIGGELAVTGWEKGGSAVLRSLPPLIYLSMTNSILYLGKELHRRHLFYKTTKVENLEALSKMCICFFFNDLSCISGWIFC
jgi:hypothetical protein